jgi:Lrp/AsnC family transcriptional regulator for asnA, asnC and gidA
MDKIDRAIVDLLMDDGRMPCSEIARRVGISERSARYRLNRLLERGIIRIVAMANPQLLGFSVMADVFIEVEPGHIMEVARRLSEFPCVSYIACSTGDRDLSIQIVARDNVELYRFVAEEIGNVPGVKKTVTLLAPLVLKDEWRIPESACDEGHGNG